MPKILKSYAKAFLLLSLVLPTQAAITQKDFESMSLSAKKTPPPKQEAQDDGLEDLDLPTVPNLVGLDPKDPAVKNEYLKGKGFTAVIVGREKSDTIPMGAVISQKPAAYSGVKIPIVIRVIISTGK